MFIQLNCVKSNAKIPKYSTITPNEGNGLNFIKCLNIFHTFINGVYEFIRVWLYF